MEEQKRFILVWAKCVHCPWVIFLPECIVVGFWNFAWCFNLQKKKIWACNDEKIDQKMSHLFLPPHPPYTVCPHICLSPFHHLTPWSEWRVCNVWRHYKQNKENLGATFWGGQICKGSKFWGFSGFQVALGNQWSKWSACTALPGKHSGHYKIIGPSEVHAPAEQLR